MEFGNHSRGENEILTRLIRGDADAFSELYLTYSGMLYAKILRLTKCEETAKEILQELFLKIWEKRSQIDVDKPFKAYLFKIAKNLMYDHFRKVARDKILSDYLVSMATLSYPHAEEAGLYQERLECMANAIEQLPLARKTVFKLCKLEGKSYEEIASQLQISTSTISDHIVKANRSIKKYLENHRDVTVSLFAAILTDFVQ